MNDTNVRLWINPAIVVEPYITWQTRYAVRVDTPKIGTNEDIGGQSGIRFGAANGQKNLFGKCSELVRGNHGRKLANTWGMG